MIKDLLQSMNNIYSDSNLNLYEKSILMYLIKQFNSNDGYSYPEYKHIMEACSIGRRENVSKTIKSLVAKGYITIKKVVGNKSHYFIDKYLHFVEEKAQEVDSNKNQVSTNEPNVKIPVITKVKATEEVQEVKVKQHPNTSKIAKETKIGLTPYYCEAFSHIDETVLEMALKEKAKSATLLLRKCIRISKEVGLAFSKEFTNKVLKFESYKEEYELASENNEVYADYINRKVSLELI